MFFFFKNKTIVVDCFIKDPIVHELFPIKPIRDDIPDWFKKLPKSYEIHVNKKVLGEVYTDSPTIRSCNGINNYYSKGIAIPLWSDLTMLVHKEGFSYYFTDGISIVTSHPPFQHGNNFQNLGHIKIESPWRFKEKTGVHFIMTEPFYNNNKILGKYFTAPGILEFKYQHATNINTFFPIKENKKEDQVKFQAGDTLAHLIPLSDKNIKIKNHLVTDVEYEKLNVGFNYSSNTYYKNKNIRIQNEKKCPFGFGK